MAVRPPPQMRRNYGSDELMTGESGSYIVYSSNSGSVAASSTGTINTTFNHSGLIFAVGMSALAGTPTPPGSTAASVGGQLEAIGNRNAFTFQITRQNSTNLMSQQALATSMFGMQDGMWWLFKPWKIARGETLGVNVTNSTATGTLTIYINYHLMVTELS